MYKVKVNDQHHFDIDNNFINGLEESFDSIKVKNGTFHILHNNKSYTAIIIDSNVAEKAFIIRVNNNDYVLQVQDKFDILLQQLGLGNLKTKKVNNIKAPMPGLVLRLEKNIGDSIKKGESVLILEAMKMENMIKSPADAVIKNIVVKQGEAVEKNQILIELE
ncbi:MAG: acetyl-CoA carboxylase biotin carboxyl carrier protein subunit [Bacteroidota bacterium]